MKTDVICPECKGTKGEQVINVIERMMCDEATTISYFHPCFYCAGTGFATDEDTFEHFWRAS